VRIIKKFDRWIPDNDKLDSGKGKKVWLSNPNNEKMCGWFKYVKMTYTKEDKEKLIPTYENVSEKIAELIANELQIHNAKIDIGTYNGHLGCLSYNILGERRTMTEGISYISRCYPKYDISTGVDLDSKTYYGIEIILNSLRTKELKNEFLKIMIFDFIIGNSDRHSNNWAIIKTKSGKEYFAPLYDNGSSLCSFVSETEIDSYLGKDKMKLSSLVDTKSRTLIRIDGTKAKIPSHKEVLKYLRKEYYDETIEFVEIIIRKLTDEKIDDILRCVNEYISHKRSMLLKRFLIEKVKILKEIYKRGD